MPEHQLAKAKQSAVQRADGLTAEGIQTLQELAICAMAGTGRRRGS